jgi:hypothetical protein
VENWLDRGQSCHISGKIAALRKSCPLSEKTLPFCKSALFQKLAPSTKNWADLRKSCQIYEKSAVSKKEFSSLGQTWHFPEKVIPSPKTLDGQHCHIDHIGKFHHPALRETAHAISITVILVLLILFSSLQLQFHSFHTLFRQFTGSYC